ncbi:MAG TPA: Rv3654c family TadE-like protein [Humibacter sp.]|nr:Rv3654c family TadE-like protein [Humibacter sp.]
MTPLFARPSRSPARRVIGGERGSGSVLAVAVLACVLVMTAAVVPTSAALVIKQRVVAAADAAALATADTASGLVAGVPCDVGRRTARRNGAALTACSVHGTIATVTASSNWLGLTITVAARAGPPGASARSP